MTTVTDAASATIAAVSHAASSGGDTHAMVSKIIFQLLIAFVAAKFVGFIFKKMKQPAVIGELLAGIILGPYVLNVLQLNDPSMHLTFEVIAEVAVILLLFSIGLETKLSDLTKVGVKAFWVAVGGVILPFVLGYIYMRLTGSNNIKSMFMGAIMVATSVGITARILKDLNFMSEEVSRVVLGAAVIDDILGLIVLSVVSGLAEKGSISLPAVIATILVIIIFLLLFTLGGVHFNKKFGYSIGTFKARNAPLIAGSVVCFTYAVVAVQIGLAAIVGAFMAGVVMAERESEYEIKQKLEIFEDVLVVFFFIIMGAKVNVMAFTEPVIIITGLVITVIAFAGKLIGCWLPVMNMGFKKASFIGMAMVPRGEVGIIIAAFALAKGIIDERFYGIAIFMVLLTTIIPPFVLEPMIKGMKKDGKKI